MARWSIRKHDTLRRKGKTCICIVPRCEHTCKVLRYGTCSLTVSPAQCAHTASVC